MVTKNYPTPRLNLSEVKEQFKIWRKTRKSPRPIPKKLWADAVTRQQNMTPDQRMQYHQENSASLMNDLKDWLQQQSDDKKVEPNSGLGQSISYMLNHWKELTLFLRQHYCRFCLRSKYHC